MHSFVFPEMAGRRGYNTPSLPESTTDRDCLLCIKVDVIPHCTGKIPVVCIVALLSNQFSP